MVSKMKMRSAYDDLDISVMVVRPEGAPRAVVQVVHGLCGCKERFLPFMEFMANKGVACVAGDHRGHGASVKSVDDLGYMYDGGYRALVDDMRMVTNWAHNEFPDIPLYMVSHSMGSMAARVYVKENDSGIDGLVVCGSPSWNPMSVVGLFLSGLMCRLGMSHMRMGLIQKMTSSVYSRRFASEGYQAWTCSDPEERMRLADNPLCNFDLTANGSYNLLSLMRETYNDSPWVVTNPTLPVVFISGEDDPVMVSEKKFHKSAQNLCDRGYVNVTSAIYPAMRHEVLNEIGKEEVWNDILDFMNLK